MIKVSIADDDLLIRTNLMMMLEKIGLDIELCGDASNGKEALHMVARHQPDILLSDVRMPLMDGIELSSKIKNEYPDTSVIMLSNYDDFEYVKAALQNGAVDYILKHSLSEETLGKSLKRAVKMIEDKKSSGMESFDKQMKRNLSLLRQELIIDLISNSFRDEEQIKAQIDILDMKLDVHNVMVVVMEIDDYKSLSSYTIKNIKHLQQTVLSIVNNILIEQGNGVIAHVSDGKYVIALSFETKNSFSRMNEQVMFLLNQISSTIKRFLNITVSLSYSNLYHRIIDIPAAYDQANKVINNKFYAGKNRILHGKPMNPTVNRLICLDIEREKLILQAFNECRQEMINRELNAVFDTLKKNHTDYSSCYMLFNELLSIVSKVCKENDIRLSEIYTDNQSAYEKINLLETFEEIKAYIMDIYQKLYMLVKQKRDHSDYIHQAIRYIKTNYHQDISLRTTAARLGVNYSYLSNVFKHEVGIGFTEYLNEVRIENAVTLLLENKTNMKDIIALCGFNSYNYFFQIFKKKMGITPKEYLKQHQHG